MKANIFSAVQDEILLFYENLSIETVSGNHELFHGGFDDAMGEESDKVMNVMAEPVIWREEF